MDFDGGEVDRSKALTCKNETCELHKHIASSVLACVEDGRDQRVHRFHAEAVGGLRSVGQIFDKLRRPSDLIMRMGFLTDTVIAADFAATGKVSLKVVKKVVYHCDTHSTHLQHIEVTAKTAKASKQQKAKEDSARAKLAEKPSGEDRLKWLPSKHAQAFLQSLFAKDSPDGLPILSCSSQGIQQTSLATARFHVRKTAGDLLEAANADSAMRELTPENALVEAGRGRRNVVERRGRIRDDS